MGFWKNDVPDIISLKKDEQGFITIEHSQGVFKIHENDVRDISFIKDQYSNVSSYISLIVFIILLGFFLLGPLHNVTNHLFVKYIFGYKSWIISAILMIIECLILVFLFWKYKVYLRGFFKQVKDIILIQNTNTNVKFRFIKKSEFKVVFDGNFDEADLKSFHVNWLWILILAFWISCSIYFWRKFCFWFPSYFPTSDIQNVVQGNGWDNYLVYLYSDVSLATLLSDGLIFNMGLGLIFVGMLLLLIAVYSVMLGPPLYSKIIYTKIFTGRKHRIEFNLNYLEDNGRYALFLPLSVLIMFSLNFNLNLDTFSSYQFVLVHILTSFVMNGIYFQSLYLIRRRKDKNHVE